MTFMKDEVLDKAAIISPLYRKLEKRLVIAGASWTASELFKVKCYAQDARDYFKDILLQSLDTCQDYRIDPTCYPSITQLYPGFTQELGDPFLDICSLPYPDDDPGTPTIELGCYDANRGLQIGYSVFQLKSRRAEDEMPVGALESVEKIVCLILFSEHIIAFCDARWEEVDTTGLDLAELLSIEDDIEDEGGDKDTRGPEAVDAVYDFNTSAEISEAALVNGLGLEPLFEEKLRLSQNVVGATGGALAGRGRGSVLDIEEVLGLIGVAQMQEKSVLQAIAI